MRNFINDAILSEPVCDACGDIDGIVDWWNSLDDVVKYSIIAGVGLAGVAVVFIVLLTPFTIKIWKVLLSPFQRGV